MKNIIILFLFVTFTSCVKKDMTETNIDNSEIENVHWSLTEFDGKPLPKSVNGKVHIYLSEDQKLTGSDGCNRIMGKYDISNKYQLSLSNIASTRMACNNTNWNESDFIKTLEMADNFTVSDKKLMLNIGKRAPLAVFSKIEQNDITNKYWKLKKLNGKEVEMAPNQEREQYFIMTDNGEFTGFAGCNQFSGNYNLEEDKLRVSFTNTLTTLRACQDVQLNESEFLKVFELTDNYTIKDNTLMLNIGRRAPLAEFEAIYF